MTVGWRLQFLTSKPLPKDAHNTAACFPQSERSKREKESECPCGSQSVFFLRGGRRGPYKIVLVSAIQQSESAVCRHTSPLP